MANNWVVLTTIQEPTPSTVNLAEKVLLVDGRIAVMGDSKGPVQYDLPGVDFFSLARQSTLQFSLAKDLPSGHYSRKNLGYLVAIQNGAACIYETDDDNSPLQKWGLRSKTVNVRRVQTTGWLNVYRMFSDELMWPRGYCLGMISESLRSSPVLSDAIVSVTSPIQQGLANGAPDADAIWYLLCDQEVVFKDEPSIYLPPGSWCPFNSQSTWWWPEAYPLMYLPSYCSFRMTDIWRGFIAQRCLWEMGFGLVFHAPEVYQQRNPHDLMRDFKDEVPGYLRNAEMAILLEKLSLSSGTENAGANLRKCYEALVEAEFFPPLELELVDSWLKDLHGIDSSS